MNTKTLTLYVSDICNLKCKYCLWPKFPQIMQRENKDVRSWISSGRMANAIQQFSSKKSLEFLSLWGGEPTLNFDLLAPELAKIADKYPNLSAISFSTNLSTTLIVNYIIDFITHINIIRPIKFDIQISIDGPSFINDINRRGASAAKIVDNIKYFTNKLIDKNLIDNVTLHTKSTLTIDNIVTLLKYDDKFFEFFEFFDRESAKCGKVFYTMPSYVFPGQYTQRQGEIYALFLYKLLNFDLNLKYITSPIEDDFVVRAKMLLQAFDRIRHRRFMGEFYSQAHCSAGREGFAIDKDDQLHICHGTFFTNEDVLQQTSYNKNFFEEEVGFSHDKFNSFVRDVGVIDGNNDLKRLRFQYCNRAIHDNFAFILSYNEAMARELVLSGQLSKTYINDDIRSLLCVFAAFKNGCLTDNLWQNGNMAISNSSILKLLGNGAFELIMNYLKDMQ